MIVIDASSLAKYILREDNWRTVRKYLADNPLSLDLALTEVSNAVWKHHVLYRKISHPEMSIMFKALNKLKEVVFMESSEKYLEAAVNIAIEEKIPVYDSLYIAQAENRGKILTSDLKQAKVAEKSGIDVKFIK